MSHRHRLLLKWAHTIHVYSTLFGFTLLLFFAVTGFLLNHEDWFGLDAPHENRSEGKLTDTILKEPDKLAVVETLRKEFRATGYVAPEDFEVQDAELRVVFRSAGGRCEATIDRESGQVQVVHESRGLIGLLTDLHRGKTGDKTLGSAWGWVIDVVAGLFVVVSLTGLILWSSLRSRGKHGLAAMMLGLAAGVAMYLVFVP